MRLFSHLVKGIVCLFFVLGCAGCDVLSPSRPLEQKIAERLGSKELVIGNTYEKWVGLLGIPRTVQQIDNTNTFFYWPEHGVAIFCHPLYKAQYDNKSKEDWIVTSILIPLRLKTHPLHPPAEEGQYITFTKLLFNPQEEISVASNVILYYDGNKLESFEIRKPDSLLGDYD